TPSAETRKGGSVTPDVRKTEDGRRRDSSPPRARPKWGEVETVLLPSVEDKGETGGQDAAADPPTVRMLRWRRWHGAANTSNPRPAPSPQPTKSIKAGKQAHPPEPAEPAEATEPSPGSSRRTWLFRGVLGV